MFYNKPSRDTLVGFPLKHDDRYHEHAIELPTKTLKGLRFNPSRAQGTIEVDWIRILDSRGETVRSWEFGDAARSAPAKVKREGRKQRNKESILTDDQRSDQAADQSQDFKIDVYADNTNQWTGKRNTLWNSWMSHPAAGYAFLRDPAKWMALRWNPGELKNVLIMVLN